MNAAQALGLLRGLRVPAVTTADAAALLGLTTGAASHTLRRLAGAGLVAGVRKGLWALQDPPEPLALAEYVTAPYPSYVSLQSALYLHGMVDQVPSVTYLVSLARTARVETGVGVYSVHHVHPSFFGGAEQDPRTGVRLATPEKALVDHLYLSPTRSRLFSRLTELELPDGFRAAEARRWVRRIPSARVKTIVDRELERLFAERGLRRGGRGAEAGLP
jgi:predicted transcriptional regulator of viral defense system